MAPGAKVVFLQAEGRKGKPAAGSVRVLSLISDTELVALLKDSEAIPPEDTQHAMAGFVQELNNGFDGNLHDQPSGALVGRAL